MENGIAPERESRGKEKGLIWPFLRDTDVYSSIGFVYSKRRSPACFHSENYQINPATRKDRLSREINCEISPRRVS